MSKPTDLTEFLLARIAEDEALWQMAADADLALVAGRRNMPAIPPEGFARRMLAECEAKRRVVEFCWLNSVTRTGPECRHADDEVHGWSECQTGVTESWLKVLRDLALPYADHSDYREEWRP